MKPHAHSLETTRENDDEERDDKRGRKTQEKRENERHSHTGFIIPLPLSCSRVLPTAACDAGGNKF